MSKIICDVCGTSYQESAMQCPICGCVRPVDIASEVDTGDTNVSRTEKYTYVKGGRFSRANVQKRNQGLLRDDAGQAERAATASPAKGSKSDKGLVIAVCALLLAIIAVVIYIVLHFFAPNDNNAGMPTNAQNNADSQTTAESSLADTVDSILCTEIVLSDKEVTLTSEGATHLLNVVLTPADTTEELLFVSEDESVATVSEDGEIVAVAAGETAVIVTCGDASAQCRVVCNIAEDPTGEVAVPTEPVGDFKAPYRLSDKDGDATIIVGQTFELKLLDANGEVIPVTWSATIADICTVEGNSVTGALKGKTELSATYDGETFTCIVRVK